MTISYSDDFIKLLFRWRGSIWKAIWKSLLLYLALYYTVNFIYRFALSEDQQKEFEKIAAYCDRATGYIPLTFLLGFFVFMVVGRWWDQFNNICWPDRFITIVSTHIRGDKTRLVRRTLARWCNLAAVLCWRGLCVKIIKRFPTMNHFVHAGMMTEQELKLYESVTAPYGKWFMPIIWVANLLQKLHEEKVIDSVQLKQLLKELHLYKSGFGSLVCYDWVSVPLVYTQVVALATYGYFGICLIGRQLLRPDHNVPGYEIDTYVPWFTILQFLFYMGWMKIGEDLMNPFGEDDDDFDMNYILDRNVQVAYMIADDTHGQVPDLEQDIFWGQANVLMPYTKASLKKKDHYFAGHLADFSIPDDDMDVISPEKLREMEEVQKETAARGQFYLFMREMKRKREREVGDLEQGKDSSEQEMEPLDGGHK